MRTTSDHFTKSRFGLLTSRLTLSTENDIMDASILRMAIRARNLQIIDLINNLHIDFINYLLIYYH